MKLEQTILATALFAVGALAKCENVIVPAYQAPTLANGWQGQLVGNGFKKPRTLHFDSEGNLIILDAGVGVRRVKFTDNGDTCLEISENKLLVDNKDLNHGLAFSGDGSTLYASTEAVVLAWDYDAKAGTVSSSPRTVIKGMSSNDHLTRTLMMSKKSDGYLTVSRGSGENFDVDAEDPSTGVSQIRVFDLNKLSDGASYDFTSGRLLGWGLRNSVGVAEDPNSGLIYSVETSVDSATRNGTNIEKNNPGEELNMHSRASDTSTGGNYGYPYCYPIWDTDVPDNEGLRTGDLFSVDENHITDEQCEEQTVEPRLVFPAHTSPLNLVFNSDGTTLYVSFRGSFNPKNPVGYMVSSVAFSNGQPSASVSANDALTEIFSNPNHDACPEGCFRPVGLAFDAQGRLWVSADSTGEIYVLKKLTDATAPGAFISSPTRAVRATLRALASRALWSVWLPLPWRR
ncbi:unnamed protein product [Parascedosporium putredinis]|uniref:Pyrroloquinoline quinone-dependent pyranose dehydrogenase beta-propeller domain-containing protein n=1 Tax=Parascedosporium putredinis TaxID=1442378 RepID=A0A9P1H0X1_9PEZI|nr:unnamed protein product [Parascedosporium putredinis]CAI7992243.1 unnamed protein product [Parascedosporium putredinis]